jgi:hypothetical protein
VIVPVAHQVEEPQQSQDDDESADIPSFLWFFFVS